MNAALRIGLTTLAAILWSQAPAQDAAAGGEARWWRGSTHAHTWWSDGDWPPELVAQWYRDQGYNFLTLSDHNTLQQGEKWYTLEDSSASAYAAYLRAFGPEWVEAREAKGKRAVRVKALEEIRSLFEAPGEFVFIQGEEITDGVWTHAVHVNGINLAERIDPADGREVGATIQNNLNLVAAQSELREKPMVATLNHPNFEYAQTAEDLFALDYRAGGLLFEIYNGFPNAQNYGDRLHESTERMWDILLARRLGALGLAPLYGLAADDAHSYGRWGIGNGNPGRGWVMVRANTLTPDAITEAMSRGDFYSSTGVTLKALDIGERYIDLEVDGRFGVSYKIEFIGTLQDTDLEAHVYSTAPHTHRGNPNHLHKTVYRYSPDIGKVLKTVNGTHARYEVQGNEIYVRARITSTFVHPNGYAGGDTEMAWTQPLVLKNDPQH